MITHPLAMALIRKSLVFLFINILSYSLSDDNYESAKIFLEQYIENATKYINPRWRPLYHVAPPVGWTNDPNGFSYHNGEFHVFYQFYPYDSVWGPMHWGHSSSSNLVNWKRLPTALLPEKEQIFSGGAVSEGNKMTLMYTGHVITSGEPGYKQSQYLAFSDDGINFQKYEKNPVIKEPPNASPDFRDPKVWRHGGYFYAIIGSKTPDNRGLVLLYKSTNMKSWEYLSVLGESSGDMGYMWECPDFFELDGKFVLLMSPQGMAAQGDRYKNLYQTGYYIGSFSYDTNQFTPEIPFQELDYGHDIYAATTTDLDGKRYLVAWFNMWDNVHPEEQDGWSGMITIPRELNIIGSRIVMKPVEAIVSLRDELVFEGALGQNSELVFGKAVEFFVDIDLTKKMDLMLEGTEGNGTVWLRWDLDAHKVVVDRGSDDIRQVEWTPLGSRSWRVFLDASSLELFCGGGEAVFSSRVFPIGGWKLTNQSPQSVNVKAYRLNPMNTPSMPSKSSIFSLNRLCYLIMTLIAFCN